MLHMEPCQVSVTPFLQISLIPLVPDFPGNFMFFPNKVCSVSQKVRLLK